MPRRDGTGPMGQGAMSGRGFGVCNSSNSQTYGYGRKFAVRDSSVNQTYGYGRGFGLGRGNNCRRNTMPNNNSKAFLAEQKTILEARLEEINKQLNK